MASDQRWTGGVANRAWNSGSRVEPEPDGDAIAAQVRRYVAECRRFGLDARYHPTEAGALKVIYCQAPRHEAAVREAFRGAASRG